MIYLEEDKMRSFIFILVYLSMLVPCSADTFIVDQNGFKDFTKIQDAINASWHGDTVIVNPGTYNENIYFNGRDITLTSIDPNDPNIVQSTEINPNSGYGVTFDFAEDSDSVLMGFTVKDSILCYDSSPTIKKNIIRDGVTGIKGEYDAAPTIIDNVITYNNQRGVSGCNGIIKNNIISNNGSINSSLEGGGINYCKGEIIDNIIKDNYAGYGGGIAYCSGLISNNTIFRNEAANYGGGIYACNSGIISHNIISGNRSPFGGGIHSSNSFEYNNTIIGNLATFTGALYQCNGTVRNNIIAFNRANLTGGIYGSCNNSYNDIWMNEGGNFGSGANAGVGDICLEPFFAVNGYWDGDIWIDGDYHLKSEAGRWDPNSQSWVIDDVTSRCIDSGDPSDSIGYEPNPNGGRINMGAYGGTAEASKSTSGYALAGTWTALNMPGLENVGLTGISRRQNCWLLQLQF